MSKSDIITKIVPILMLAMFVASCSSDDDEIGVSPDEPDAGTRTVTVMLHESQTTRTHLTQDALLIWDDGDKVAYFTSADGTTWTTSKEAIIDPATNSFSATNVPAEHSKIRVVYPSPGVGKPYEKPQVKKHQIVTTDEFLKYIDRDEGKQNDRSMMMGRYLPMEVEPTEIPTSNVVNAIYDVQGAVIRFRIKMPADGISYGIKAIKAGNYLFECDMDWEELDNWNYPGWKGIPIDTHYPIDYYNEYPFCVVVPLGQNVEYTPTVYAQVWDNDSYTSVEKTFTRNATKRDTFTPKAYDIELNLSNTSLYDVSDGWMDFAAYDPEPDYSEIEVVPIRYSYSLLDSKNQQVYDYIVDRLQNYEANASDYNDIRHRVYLHFNEVGYYMSFNKLMTFLDLIVQDMPEMFHLMPVPRYGDSGNSYYAQINAVWTPEKYSATLAQIDGVAKDMLKGIKPSMSDFEKVKRLHDNFLKHTHYGGMNDANGGNIVGGFINGAVVCEGMARSFLYLCQHVGVKCMYVSGTRYEGTTTDPDTGAEKEILVNHAWNFVEVDGQWYMLDLTDDGGFTGFISYVRFLKGQEMLRNNYRLYSSDGSNPNINVPAMPTLSATDYRY